MIDTDIQLCGGGYTACISSLRGGTCFRLFHAPTGAELLRTPHDEEELAENVFLFGNPILFPPNRILGAHFTFDGRAYTLPLNEPATGCHVHGALYAKPFRIEEQTASGVRLSYTAEAGEYIGFPHAFTLIRTYRLEETGLWEQDEVINLSELPMPFLLAYHTTFRIPFVSDTAPCDHRVTLKVGREEMRTEKFIPTGEFRAPALREEAFANGEYVPCGKHLSAFYEGGGRMLLTDTQQRVRILYDADEQFAYRMLFQTAEGSFFVCEPQTAAIDCFRLPGGAAAHGLISLAPGEHRFFETRMGVEAF